MNCVTRPVNVALAEANLSALNYSLYFITLPDIGSWTNHGIKTKWLPGRA